MTQKIVIDPSLPVKVIMQKYGISQAAAYRAKNKGYIVLTGPKGGRVERRIPQGFKLSETECLKIARNTAKRFISHLEHDLREEIIQAVLIELWATGAKDVPQAYRIARIALRRALEKWRGEFKVTVSKKLGINEIRFMYGLSEQDAIKAKKQGYFYTKLPMVSFDDWMQDYDADGLGGLDMGEGDEK